MSEPRADSKCIPTHTAQDLLTRIQLEGGARFHMSLSRAKYRTQLSSGPEQCTRNDWQGALLDSGYTRNRVEALTAEIKRRNLPSSKPEDEIPRIRRNFTERDIVNVSLRKETIWIWACAKHSTTNSIRLDKEVGKAKTY